MPHSSFVFDGANHLRERTVQLTVKVHRGQGRPARWVAGFRVSRRDSGGLVWEGRSPRDYGVFGLEGVMSGVVNNVRKGEKKGKKEKRKKKRKRKKEEGKRPLLFIVLLCYLLFVSCILFLIITGNVQKFQQIMGFASEHDADVNMITGKFFVCQLSSSVVEREDDVPSYLTTRSERYKEGRKPVCCFVLSCFHASTIWKCSKSLFPSDIFDTHRW